MKSHINQSPNDRRKRGEEKITRENHLNRCDIAIFRLKIIRLRNACHAFQHWFSVYGDVVLYKYWPIIRIMWLFGGRLWINQYWNQIKMVSLSRSKQTNRFKQAKKKSDRKEKLNVSIYWQCHISHTNSHHYPYTRVYAFCLLVCKYECV